MSDPVPAPAPAPVAPVAPAPAPVAAPVVPAPAPVTVEQLIAAMKSEFGAKVKSAASSVGMRAGYAVLGGVVGVGIERFFHIL